MNLRQMLLSVPLFSQVLDQGQVETLAGRSREAFFPDGATLMEEGDFGGSMFVIVTGIVTVTAQGPDGAMHDIAELHAGDIVGEMSLMTGARRTATVTAATAVNAIEIPKAALEAILVRAPALLDRFAPLLAARQSELDRILAERPPRWHVFGLDAEQIIGQMRRAFASRG